MAARSWPIRRASTARSARGGIAFAGGKLKALDSGGISTNKLVAATSTILLDTTNGAIVLGGNIASTSSGLTLAGANTLTLAGSNSFTGAITLNGGTLVTDTAGINGTSTANGMTFAGGTLKALDSGGINTSKAISATGTILLDTSSGPITLNGNIASTASSLTCIGTNTLTLSGTNGYTGTTFIEGGTLVTDTAGINGPSAANGITLVGGTLKALNSTGINTNKAIFAVTLQLDTSNGPITLGGNLTAVNSGLTLSTANALTLAGANSLTGSLRVEQGTLVITTSAALPAATALIVGAGGEFVFDPIAANGNLVLGSSPQAVSSHAASASPAATGAMAVSTSATVESSVGQDAPAFSGVQGGILGPVAAGTMYSWSATSDKAQVGHLVSQVGTMGLAPSKSGSANPALATVFPATAHDEVLKTATDLLASRFAWLPQIPETWPAADNSRRQSSALGAWDDAISAYARRDNAM